MELGGSGGRWWWPDVQSAGGQEHTRVSKITSQRTRPWSIARKQLTRYKIRWFRSMTMWGIYLFIFLFCFFSSSHLLSSHILLSLLPTRNSDPGSHSRQALLPPSRYGTVYLVYILKQVGITNNTICNKILPGICNEVVNRVSRCLYIMNIYLVPVWSIEAGRPGGSSG